MTDKFKKIFLLLCVLATPSFAADSAHPLSMWQIEGQTNRIFLLGSIHLLREKDHPIPSAIIDAYREAETLIMELDMDDMDPVESQSIATELGLIHDGRTLADWLGPETYAEAEKLALAAMIPLNLLSGAEPWYAAMNVELMLLMRIGFDPALGIESHLMQMAAVDRKEILGFETMRQQLELLDGLSADAQREMFLQALSEGSDMLELMDGMIDAWRHGDTAYIEENLLADMQNYPELNQAIVINRNRDWVDQIEALLDDDDDYMIIVGTLHLVGDGGVPELLSDRGHTVMQLQQSAN